jgi:Uma2 family endonuclease
MAINTLEEKILAVPTVPIWRLSVEQYHKMAQVGILTDDDPVELLEGLLVIKMTKNRAHSMSTRKTRETLAEALPSGWHVDSQEPITTAHSEPEPDVFVVRGKPEDYPDRHPYPEDIALIIEVSDTTLQRDRTLKLRIYAQARIPLYWILNLQERQLEAHTDPHGSGDKADYHQPSIYRETDAVPLVIEGQEVARLAVRDLLP